MITLYPVEYLNSINCSGLPLAKLKLKVGCPVMILRNLNAAEGVCNGSRGIVTRMSDRVLEVRLLTRSHAGTTTFIPRLSITPSSTQVPFEFCVRVSPVALRLGSEMDPYRRDLTNILHSYLVSDSFGPVLGARA